jgi:hypothetical protein
MAQSVRDISCVKAKIEDDAELRSHDPKPHTAWPGSVIMGSHVHEPEKTQLTHLLKRNHGIKCVSKLF